MESMSNCPYLLKNARTGYRLGNGEIIDSMINDGLWDAYENFHMGMTGELVAEKYKITRQEQDQFACESHRKAIHAIKSCFFGEQILPLADHALQPAVLGRGPLRHLIEGKSCLRDDGALSHPPRCKPCT